PNGEEVGPALEEPLHNSGHVTPSPCLDASVQLLLSERRQAGQRTADLARLLVQTQHGFQLVLVAAVLAPLTGELEGDGPCVLADWADDALLGQLLAGAAEGVAWCQLASDTLVKPRAAQGFDEVEVPDADARAGPADDLAEQAGARRDQEG